MKPSLITHTTATFVVRMWMEPSAEDKGEWRGQVEHVQSGAQRYFRALDEVLDFIAGHLDGEEEEQGAT